VVGFERRKLQRAGLGALADKVRWVSDVEGDGAGYDILSFEPGGQRRLLEVKTTCGNDRTPFWMTKRECDVAAEQGAHYRVRGLFHFRNELRTSPLRLQTACRWCRRPFPPRRDSNNTACTRLFSDVSRRWTASCAARKI
jgi:hypothetical protein